MNNLSNSNSFADEFTVWLCPREGYIIYNKVDDLFVSILFNSTELKDSVPISIPQSVNEFMLSEINKNVQNRFFTVIEDKTLKLSVVSSFLMSVEYHKKKKEAENN